MKGYWVIPVSLAIIGYFGMFWTLALSDTEHDINFNFTIDDNTLEAIKSINYTSLKDNPDCNFRTEKGYYAKECYENEVLIPCMNFSFDEHFCNKGICKVNGICPTYYERLKGKTVSDCIQEVKEK